MQTDICQDRLVFEQNIPECVQKSTGIHQERSMYETLW